MTSRPQTAGKLPLTDLADMKSRRERIVMVTAYDYPSGRLADAAGVDIRFSLGLDGLSLWMFALSGLLTVTAILVSWDAIRDRGPTMLSWSTSNRRARSRPPVAG